MTAASAPTLRQFAVRPELGPNSSSLSVDAKTGLLHREGKQVPWIEEMIAQGRAWQSTGETQTVLTETTDPLDPDLVRSLPRQSFMDAVSSSLTKIGDDTPDPDLVRPEALWIGMATVLTRMEPDQPDPDLVRAKGRDN